ncbi:MarR family winged helix-turn-helix transcriptional regulator [Novispirillum sp. DQ9]|uniref:MarR family winged helix-turn-helix transcriptional regulator n=1 Tax=Novispirillum sp. DQ9 TaxID=3398612 RepID=UPI003C7D6B16
MNDDSLPLHHMPGHLVRRCHQISVGLFHEVCGETGLTPIQFAILSGIESHPGIEQIQLSKLAGVDRTTIGNVIYRLEGRGHIQRQSDDKDRRIKRLTLTDEGRAILEAVRPMVEEVQALLLGPLDDAEKEQFIRLLTKLVLANNEGSRAPLDFTAG